MQVQIQALIMGGVEDTEAGRGTMESNMGS